MSASFMSLNSCIINDFIFCSAVNVQIAGFSIVLAVI